MRHSIYFAFSIMDNLNFNIIHYLIHISQFFKHIIIGRFPLIGKFRWFLRFAVRFYMCLTKELTMWDVTWWKKFESSFSISLLSLINCFGNSLMTLVPSSKIRNLRRCSSPSIFSRSSVQKASHSFAKPIRPILCHTISRIFIHGRTSIRIWKLSTKSIMASFGSSFFYFNIFSM